MPWRAVRNSGGGRLRAGPGDLLSCLPAAAIEGPREEERQGSRQCKGHEGGRVESSRVSMMSSGKVIVRIRCCFGMAKLLRRGLPWSRWREGMGHQWRNMCTEHGVESKQIVHEGGSRELRRWIEVYHRPVLTRYLSQGRIRAKVCSPTLGSGRSPSEWQTGRQAGHLRRCENNMPSRLLSLWQLVVGSRRTL